MNETTCEARQNTRIPLDIYMNKLIDGVPHLARTKNISRSGIYLHRLLEPQAAGDARVAVEFVLPGTERVICADTTIVHERGVGAGLAFVDLTPAQRRVINDFVASTSVC